MPITRRLRGTLHTALFLAAVAAPGAFGHLVAQAPEPTQHQTPFDQTMRPLLDSLKQQNAATGGSNVVAPAVQNYVSSPNFAGYQNAPLYSARSTAALANGTSSTAVDAVVSADFNKDGKTDLAVILQNGTLNVLLNNGSGAFPTNVTYANPSVATTSVNQSNFYAVDVNKDGYADLVGYDSNNATVIVWLNLGNGTFGAAQTTPVNTTYGYPVAAAAGDVNGDGQADVVLVSQTGTSLVLQTMLSNGKGSFTAAAGTLLKTSAIGVSFTNNSGEIALGDLNGDGKLDIAVGLQERPSATTGLYVVTTALGAGDGSFGTLGANKVISASVAPSGIRNTISFAVSGIHLADVNKDGKLDILSDSTSVLYTATGVGDGTFNAQVSSTFNRPSNAAFFDVTGDGIVDAVNAGNGTSNVAIYNGKGDGTFAFPTVGQSFVTDPAVDMVAGDFDGDGKTDVAVLGADYKCVSIFFANGTSLRGAPLVTSAADPGPLDFSLATVLKDSASGFSDIIAVPTTVAPATATIQTGVADGKGNFTWVNSVPKGLPSTWGYIQPIAADFNGDGLQDLVIAGTAGSDWVALAKGDGTFGVPVSVGMPTLACASYYGAAGDLNGDGKQDLVIVYPGDSKCSTATTNPSEYFVLLGNGDGTFKAPVAHNAGTSLYSVTLADMNGDGKLDILLDNVIAGGYAVYYIAGNGDGTFASYTSTLLSNYVVSSIATGDINGDGKNDVVMASEEVSGFTVATGSIVTIAGNGDGTFQTPSQIAQGNWFYTVNLADVNNDGNLDIIAPLNSATGQPNTYYGMVTLLGLGNGQFSAPYNSLQSLAGTVAIPGHFLNDGAVDVASTTGYGIGLFYGQGGSTIALKASAASATFATNETLTATVAPYLTGRPSATGTVTFYDGTTVLGTATLNAGVATFTTSSLAVGAHTVKAIYAGDTNYNPATSSTSTVTITTLAPAFTLAGGASTLSVQQGAQGLVTLNLAANATFSGAVTLTCSGAPTNATCAVNPGSVTLAANGTGTATLVIGTTGLHTAAISAPHHSNGIEEAAMALGAMGGLLFLRRRNARKLAALTLGLLITAGVLMTGCSSGGPTAPTSGATTFTVQVTATPTSGNGTAQTTSVAVTVN